MKEITCDFCNKKFKRKKSQLKLSVKHYCSVNCQTQGRKKGMVVKCFMCDIFIYKPLKDFDKTKPEGYTFSFTILECFYIGDDAVENIWGITKRKSGTDSDQTRNDRVSNISIFDSLY